MHPSNAVACESLMLRTSIGTSAHSFGWEQAAMPPRLMWYTPTAAVLQLCMEGGKGGAPCARARAWI